MNLIVLILAFVAADVYAYDLEIDGIYYNISTLGQGLEVTYEDENYNSYSGDVFIPGEVLREKIIEQGVELPEEYSFGETVGVIGIGERAFKNCTDLESIRIEGTYIGFFIDDEVKSREVAYIGKEAFAGCTQLKSIEVRGGDYYQDEYWPEFESFIGESAFEGCTGLTSVVLDGFACIQDGAFRGCANLSTLKYFGSVYNDYGDIVGHCHINAEAFADCDKLVVMELKLDTSCDLKVGHDAFRGVGNSDVPCSLTLISDMQFPESDDGDGNQPRELEEVFDIDVSTEGLFEWRGGVFSLDRPVAYAQLSVDGKTLTFFYDDGKENREGMVFELNEGASSPEWISYANEVEKVIFDSSFDIARPTSNYQWFSGMVNLTDIQGLSYLNTSEVTTMYCMFRECSSLESLDLSNMNTSSVSSMTAMMMGCTNLREVNLKGIDLSMTKSIRMMFQNCVSLKSLDFSGWDTFDITDMRKMMEGCTALESVDLSSFIFAEEANTEDFLKGCSSLKKLVIPKSANNLADNACQGVGSVIQPCEISAPEDFDFGVQSTDGLFCWKDGYFVFGEKTVTMTAEAGEILPGRTSKLVISLSNGEKVFNGYQFDVYLPYGVTLAMDGRRYAYELSDRYSEGEVDVGIHLQENDGYRLLCFSMSNAIITGSEGPIVTLTLEADESLTPDVYDGLVSSIIMSSPDGVSIDLPDAGFVLKVNEFTGGDVNHDGVTNVTDVMAVVNYILSSESEETLLDTANADINGDRRIDVTDVMMIVNIILSQTE